MWNGIMEMFYQKSYSWESACSCMAGPGVGHRSVKHARQRFPLVQAYGISHQHYLLSFIPSQQFLPIEPSQIASCIFNSLLRNLFRPMYMEFTDWFSFNTNYLGSSQALGFHLYLRYILSGRPYFWQSNSGSTKGQADESYIGYDASKTQLPWNMLQLAPFALSLLRPIMVPLPLRRLWWTFNGELVVASSDSVWWKRMIDNRRQMCVE